MSHEPLGLAYASPVLKHLKDPLATIPDAAEQLRPFPGPSAPPTRRALMPPLAVEVHRPRVLHQLHERSSNRSPAGDGRTRLNDHPQEGSCAGGLASNVGPNEACRATGRL